MGESLPARRRSQRTDTATRGERRRICFLSTDAVTGIVSSDHLSAGPLADRGIGVETVSWRDAGTDWRTYDGVIIRSTWDYQVAPDGFLGTLERIEEQKAPVANPVDVVRWNMNKRYLGRLSDQGFPVIPTRYLKTWNQDQVMAVANELGSRTLVVKPVIGASAGGVFRLRLTSSGTMEISAKDTESIAPAELSTIYEGQEVLIQPLIESVISEGEYSLFYFRGRYSHAICKSPRDGDFRVQEEHGGTNRPVDPSGEMVDLGASVVSAVGGTKLLYARVDVIRGRGGQWQVMELELIEPSLYLDMDPESPERFADAIDEWLGEEANGRV